MNAPSKKWFLRAARLCARLAAGLCLLLSIRLLWLTWEETSAQRARQLEASSDTLDRKRDRENLTPAPTSSTQGQATQAPSSRRHEPTPTSPPRTSAPQMRSLFVDLGSPRSEVYVNGRRLGETPFVGQWSCADGESVRIQVVPPRGMPLERKLVCGGVVMNVKP